MKINKKEFIEAYNNHKPNKWISLIYKNFSDENCDGSFTIRNIVSVIFLSLFFVGFFSMLLFNGSAIVRIITITYTLLLMLLVLCLFVAVIMNRFRIKRIIKELNITEEYYVVLVRKYLL